MEDFFLSIAAKIAEYAVLPILHHAQYLCCFHNFASNIPNVKEQLELTRDNVKERIREAINRTERVEPAVEKWLKDVEKVLDELRRLEERILNVNKSYFKRHCQYSLTKEIARNTAKMIQLDRNSKFEPFSRITELPGMKYYSSNDFIMFKSTESSYRELLEAIKNKSVSMIGLVGLGGSGKTTLAKEVGKKVEEMKLFEKAVMATVSQRPNITSIQLQIADQLNFELKEESEIGRAQRLSERLKKGTTLVILDDVWEKLKFEALGIPFDSKACCVLVTTRSKDVCTYMQCQLVIELNLLFDEEAWTLFSLYANIIDDCSEALKDVARKIVNECKGLPIAIVSVGSTLKGKTIEEFELALLRLEDSKPLDIPKGLISPYVCLELSYDNLTNQLAQSLLLVCSMFPEDCKIDLEDIFRFGRGLGIIGTFRTMEIARREMHVAINILGNSCLLMDVEGDMRERGKKWVKMHDLVRDVSLWIASKIDQTILTCTDVDPEVLVDDENMKDKKAIALWDLKKCHFFGDYKINCPRLEILLLSSREGGIEVSHECLQSLEMLKILAILNLHKWSRTTVLTLPESVKSLKNLRTLCLRGHDLGDISFVERLQALEILDLRGSSFEELPVGIVELKKLKLLDLLKCVIKKHKEVEAYEVVGKCLQLEELYLYLVNFIQDFPHNVSFSRLQRYLIINYYKGYFDYFRDHMLHIFMENCPMSRSLVIDYFDVPAQSFISLPIKDLFIRAEYLHLRYLMGDYKNIIPSMDPQGMNLLIFLHLKSCSEIECLIDSITNASTSVGLLQTEVVFSTLVYLILEDLRSLKEVFCDPSSRCSLKNLEEIFIDDCSELKRISFPRNSKLCNLKVLKISRCRRLTSLFMPSIFQTLVLLEVLEISFCIALRHLIEEGNGVSSSTQNHSSFTLPKLRILDIEGCDNLEYIFPVLLAEGLVSLERVRIVDNFKLKYVFGSEKEHDRAMYQSFQQNNTKRNLSNLDTLDLNGLPNLEKFHCIDFKEVTASNLRQQITSMENEIMWLITNTFNQLDNILFQPQPKALLKFGHFKLTRLRVKGLFQFQMGEQGGGRELLPLNLDISNLRLKNLPELNFIWKGPTGFLSLQKLHYIEVDRCPKLKTIFSTTVVRSLPMLNKLQITNCDELEQIFDLGDAQQLKTLHSSQQVCFPTLSTIEVKNCNKLKCLFYNLSATHFTRLTSLEIQECFQLHKAFAFGHEADDDSEEGTGKDEEQLLLQNLTYITLKHLSNFEEIHHGFKLKDDVQQTIEECPKYSPSLYLHPDI